MTLLSGSVGSGKSTLIDAICFVLFNRPYSDNTKPSLINSINQKQLKVIVEFTADKKLYKIIRGSKPSIFEIYENDILINQDAATKDYQKHLELNILKMNYRSFTQICIAGGGTEYVPFMKLAAKDRREFVEDLLDIRVFSTMNILAKDKVKSLKETIKEINSEIKSTKEKVSLQEDFIKKLKKEKSNSSDNLLESIRESQEEIDRCSELVSDYMLKIESLSSSVSSHLKVKSQIEKNNNTVSSLESDIFSLKSKSKKYALLDNCPTCSQIVNDSHKQTILNSFESDIKNIEVDISDVESKIKSSLEELKSYESDVAEFKELSNTVKALQQDITSNQLVISKSQKQLNAVSDTVSIDSEETKLKSFAKEYFRLDKEKSDILDEQQYYDFILDTLTDSGIKSKIIRQYIPEINRRINKYLNDLEFFCMYELDEEFKESIKSRHRDNFTYEFFSQGQKRLIDLSILMTWMDIAKAKNAISCNIWFGDELDAPLDDPSKELMFKMLVNSNIKNIFVISHRKDVWEDKVDNVIEFRLHNNFSEIVK
jgi:DNA repair exonuclease SbcCD ATPase subunit